MNRKRHPSERLCNTGSCEDEIHLLVCPLYKDLRYMSQNNHDFSNMSNFEKMLYLMQFHQHEVISYIQNAWKMRSLNI